MDWISALGKLPLKTVGHTMKPDTHFLRFMANGCQFASIFSPAFYLILALIRHQQFYRSSLFHHRSAQIIRESKEVFIGRLLNSTCRGWDSQHDSSQSRYQTGGLLTFIMDVAGSWVWHSETIYKPAKPQSQKFLGQKQVTSYLGDALGIVGDPYVPVEPCRFQLKWGITCLFWTALDIPDAQVHQVIMNEYWNQIR